MPSSAASIPFSGRWASQSASSPSPPGTSTGCDYHPSFSSERSFWGIPGKIISNLFESRKEEAGFRIHIDYADPDPALVFSLIDDPDWDRGFFDELNL